MALSPSLVSKIKLFSWLSTVLGLSAMTAFDPRGLRRSWKLRDEVAALRDSNEKLAAQNRALARDVSSLQNNPRYIERAVREELGFIHSGEAVLTLLGSRPQAAAKPGKAQAPGATP